jgi:Tol biopolymer transport system component
MSRIIACWIFLSAAASLDGQVVLSRRVYAEHGRTWRQLWMASRGSVDFKQLTHSARDHMEPLCSRDGNLIYFVSDRDGLRSLNAYAGDNDRELWAYDRQTGRETVLWQTDDDDVLHLVGTTADGAVLVRAGTGLRSVLHHPWQIDVIDLSFSSAAVSPDGRTLALVIPESLDKEGQSQNARLFLVDTATGQSRVEVGKYEAPSWSPDGKRIAVIAESGLAIIDAATLKEVVRKSWPNLNNPPEELVWSPDGKYLLAGLYGEEGGSGDPQRDYFLLDLAAGKWTPALTAQTVVWLPSGGLLYLRPVKTTPLAPGSPHQVWTAQLALFDLATRKDTEMTTGLVLNDYLAACGQ